MTRTTTKTAIKSTAKLTINFHFDIRRFQHITQQRYLIDMCLQEVYYRNKDMKANHTPHIGHSIKWKY